MNLDRMKELCRTKKLRWTDHIFKRLLQRSISMNDVQMAILNGVLVEDYPDDYPFPSCLILGYRFSNGALHIVCAPNNEQTELWLITAYIPDSEKWNNDFKTRRVE